MAPSKKTMYRRKNAVKNHNLKCSDIFWERLESYLETLKVKQPKWTVELEKTSENQFKRYFIGMSPVGDLLRLTGLDLYQMETCVITHPIASGMHVRVLSQRTGNDTVLVLAFSVEVSETGGDDDGYRWFAQQCQKMGFSDILKPRISANGFVRKPVLFSDRSVGTTNNPFAELFPELHHAR